jgi:uncharacterized protein
MQLHITHYYKLLRTKLIAGVRKLLSLRASPHQIACGFSIGVFVGIFPTFGLGIIVILALAAAWKFNIAAALIGTILGNPLFMPFWVILTCVITGISPEEIKLPQLPFRQMFFHYSHIGVKYLFGNLVLSMAMAAISYFIILRSVIWFKRRESKKVNS